MEERLTITEVAESVGVTPRTIMRWEKSGKVKRPKRDWRGWRFYYKQDIDDIKKFYETCYECDENGNGDGAVAAMKTVKEIFTVIIAFGLCLSLVFVGLTYAESDNSSQLNDTGAVTETATSVDIDLNRLTPVPTRPLSAEEGIKYTLGPNDVILIEVRRHPEFSGQYAINSEGKIEYKFVGDIFVSGFTKKELKERLTNILSEFVVEPEVNVQIVAYLSKVFYVVGEVGKPGKYYMRGDTTTVREALVDSGLPTIAAAMRRCRLITPDNIGRNNYKEVDVYSLLYEGNLKKNLVMNPGDVLYVPATAIAKIMRVISPVTDTVSNTAGAAVTGAALVP